MRPDRFSLVYVYYVLAAFAVAIVSVSLYTTHQVAATFSKSVQVNESWANIHSQLAALGELASRVNAPGNDVFDSHDVPAESKRMRAAQAEFDRDLANLRRQFQSNNLGPYADTIAERVKLTKTAMDAMRDEADRIFSHFERGESEEAGRRMATMDRRYAEVHSALYQLRATVAELQSALFAGEQSEVQSIWAIERVIAFGALLLVAAVTLYGHWASVQSERSRQMKLAHDKAVESTRLKSEFLANMSHEIRTPLNAVVGMTALILETKLSDDQREYAETVHSSGAKLLGIVNDILDFSKIEAGKMSIQSEPFDLSQLAEDVVDLFSATANEKRLDLMLHYPASIPHHFEGDQDRVRQILVNLVGNALKFTESGHVMIEASMAGKSVRISVIDTGIGIPEDRIASLFEMFTQADESTTRRYGGTGLGLSICKNLTELMKGTIKVESTEGVGSKFTVTLPLPVAPGTDLPPTRAFELTGLRVLLVDHHPVNRRILHDQLSAKGVRSESFGTGTEALAGFRAALTAGDPFHIVIADYQMPGLDGAELASHIRDADPDVGFILLGSVGRWVEQNMIQPGMIDACLSKPVRSSKLLDTLLRLWAKRSDAAEEPRESTPHESLEGASESALESRVLVAEDNAANQKLARLQLAKLNVRVDIVANGREALEQVQLAPYEFVLMDCAMPEMNGYDATEAIRNLPSPVAKIPIIAMTANAVPGSKERCMAAGMNDFLTKPVSPEALKAVVERWRSAPQPVAV